MVLTVAVTHFKHVLLIRYDIGPRSVEISRLLFLHRSIDHSTDPGWMSHLITFSCSE
jgi:hypothetical protein